MREPHRKAKQSLKGDPANAIHKTKFSFLPRYIEHGVLPKTKRTFRRKVWETNKCKII